MLLDVSQLHVGGYTSFIIVNPKSAGLWVFWLPGMVKEQKWKLYGRQPVPSEIPKVIVDELNTIWGHVASFSWREGALTFGPPKVKVLPNKPLQPTSGAKIGVE